LQQYRAASVQEPQGLLGRVRLYRPKEGKVVEEGDDLMSATRYAIMMVRFASTKSVYDRFRRPIEYSRVGWC
jgi:hypothetical protein